MQGCLERNKGRERLKLSLSSLYESASEQCTVEGRRGSHFPAAQSQCFPFCFEFFMSNRLSGTNIPYIIWFGRQKQYPYRLLLQVMRTSKYIMVKMQGRGQKARNSPDFPFVSNKVFDSAPPFLPYYELFSSAISPTLSIISRSAVYT